MLGGAQEEVIQIFQKEQVVERRRRALQVRQGEEEKTLWFDGAAQRAWERPEDRGQGAGGSLGMRWHETGGGPSVGGLRCHTRALVAGAAPPPPPGETQAKVRSGRDRAEVRAERCAQEPCES